MLITVFGAGSIGNFIGGSLVAAGETIEFLGRKRMGNELFRHGLTLGQLNGSRIEISSSKITFGTDPKNLERSDLVIVCVKSQDTHNAAEAIHEYCKPDAVIISLQNGVGNKSKIAEICGNRTVLGGMVPFNVVHMGNGQFNCTTDGTIVLENHAISQTIADCLNSRNVKTVMSCNIESVMWGKLCMNLNNPLNALAGIPLRNQLESRKYREVLALSIEEALAVANALNIIPANIGKVRPRLSPHVLRLPTPIFRIIASGMVKIDPQARSSMWDDLVAGKQSEIDYLNGAIVSEGERTGVATPVNAGIVELVKQAFAKGKSPQFSGEELLEQVL